jgi:hypothetical protein
MAINNSFLGGMVEGSWQPNKRGYLTTRQTPGSQITFLPLRFHSTDIGDLDVW